jgi:hypothetical protein
LRLAVPRLVEEPLEDLVQHEDLRQQCKGETFSRARAQDLTVPGEVASATILIRQGESMGRPGRLTVDVPARGGIVVTGTAVPI